jgi:organic hydroperoxide reductase OsmC/OhrA
MVELVWDERRRGTGQSASGVSLTVGENAHFSAGDLLSLGAAACLMDTFLALAEAARLPVLSYLSTAELVHDSDSSQPAHVRVRVYVATTSEAYRRQLEVLLTRARVASATGCLLGERLVVAGNCHVLADRAQATHS